ncbi:hypothetical protein Hanom_Chr15g01408991 [Helianthus anomalus]
MVNYLHFLKKDLYELKTKQDLICLVTYKDARSSKSQCLENIGSTADTTIQEHRYTTLCRFHNLFQSADCSWNVIQLASSMVGNNNTRCSSLNS